MEISSQIALTAAAPVHRSATEPAADGYERALARIAAAETVDEAIEGFVDAFSVIALVDGIQVRPDGAEPTLRRCEHDTAAKALERLAGSRRRARRGGLAGVELSRVRPARNVWGLAGRIDATRGSYLLEATGPGAPPEGGQLQLLFAAALCFRERLETFDALANRDRHARIVANVAHAIHDLRSPVANSLGFLSLLKRTLPAESQELRWTDIALEELRRLRTMLAGLLDVTRSEIGFDHIRPVELDLAQVVQSTTTVVAEAAGRDVRVHSPEAVLVEADPTAMSKLITNLLENAFKYSPESSPVVVDVSADQARARLAVRDEGTGIEPDDMTNIFEPFVRSESTEAAQPGLGLGLSICRAIARVHGGRITVQSELGRGSTFTVELPRRQR